MIKTGLVVTFASALIFSSTGTANAQIVKAPTVINAVIGGPETKFDFPVTSNKKVPGRDFYAVEVYHTDPVFNYTGLGESKTASFVVKNSVPSVNLFVGDRPNDVDNPFVAYDIADGRAHHFEVRAKRRGKTSFTSASVSGTKVTVKFKATHYDVPTGTYKPDNLGPVKVQRFNTSTQTWQSLTPTLTTNRAGEAVGTFTLPRGQHALRGYRLEGATVTSSYSPVDEVCVGGC